MACTDRSAFGGKVDNVYISIYFNFYIELNSHKTVFHSSLLLILLISAINMNFEYQFLPSFFEIPFAVSFFFSFFTLCLVAFWPHWLFGFYAAVGLVFSYPCPPPSLLLFSFSSILSLFFLFHLLQMQCVCSLASFFIVFSQSHLTPLFPAPCLSLHLSTSSFLSCLAESVPHI